MSDEPKPKPLEPAPKSDPIPAPTPTLVRDDYEIHDNTPHSIRYCGSVHCARGPIRCPTCKLWSETKHWFLYCLDDPDVEEARPMVSFRSAEDGEVTLAPYKVVGVFSSGEEARRFAVRNPTLVYIDGSSSVS